MNRVNRFTPGESMPLYFRLLSKAVRFLYFHQVNLIDVQGGQMASLSESRVPIIFYISHRNGAIDGYIAQKLHKTASSMVSVQLTAHPYLKWFFSGIPVLRPKDVERFGCFTKELGNPVLQSIKHVEAGGSLFIYPEGSSEWGYTHLPYQAGGAKIVRHLLEQGQSFEVRAVGLFYKAPDQFRSHVDVVVSDPIKITLQQAGESKKAWEMRVFEQMNHALDHVSVNCHDQTHFEQVEQHAHALSLSSGFYGAHFLNAQKESVDTISATNAKKANVSWFSILCTLYFMLLMWPVMLVGWLAGKTADAKNTVSFFRIVAIMPLLPIWLGFLLWFAFPRPLFLASLGFAIFGFFSYSRVRSVFFKKEA